MRSASGRRSVRNLAKSTRYGTIRAKDIILAVEGQRVTTGDQIQSILYDFHPGDTVTLIVYRGGYQHEVEVILGESVS